MISTPLRCPASVALVLISILVSLSAATASAQEGVTTFTGLVTINGKPAPEETLVRITLEDGGQLGSTLTGFSGLKPNEYSLEIKSDPAYAGKKVLLTLPRVANSEPVVAAFEPNTIIVAHVAVFSVAPTATPTPEPGGVAIVSIPAAILLSAEGAGVDSDGAVVRTTGDLVHLTEPGQSIVMPIAVPEGRVLQEFEDPVSGLTVRKVEEGYLVRAPIRDAEGNDQIRVLVVTSELAGTGSTAEGLVISMGIDLPTLQADLSSLDPKVGVASVKVTGDLVAFPSDASLEQWVRKSLDEQTSAAVSSALRQLGLEIDDVPFSITFDERNLGGALATVTLRVGVGRAWVNSFAVANIRGFHVSDDGSAEIIDATPIDLNADPVVFTLVSPTGLSGFGLAALRKAQQAAATKTAVALQASPPTQTPLPTETATAVPTRRPTGSGFGLAALRQAQQAAATQTAVALQASIPTQTPLPTETATAVQQPVATPPSVPTVLAQVTPIPLAPSASAPAPAGATSPANTAAISPQTVEPDQTPGAGGSCSAPRAGGNRVELGFAALLVGLIALRARRLR